MAYFETKSEKDGVYHKSNLLLVCKLKKTSLESVFSSEGFSDIGHIENNGLRNHDRNKSTWFSSIFPEYKKVFEESLTDFSKLFKPNN